MSTKKFRPYLTLSEFRHLVKALKLEGSSQSVPLIQYLEGYILQIEMGMRKENLTTSAPAIKASSVPATRPISTLIELYSDTGFSGFSLPEIALVEEYRYDKQLMSMDEEAAYESKLMSGF